MRCRRRVRFASNATVPSEETSPRWQQARALMAKELVAAIHAGVCLVELQHELLQPLESDAVSRELAGSPIPAADAVRAVLSGVAKRQAEHRLIPH